MIAAADFHALAERWCLAGTLTTRTALRIGSGGGGELDSADLPVLKDARGYPFVPGASLKGVVRSTIESLVRGAVPASKDTELRACDPLDKTACGYHEAKQRKKALDRPHCAVCQLLGSHVLASHVRFCDALLVVPDESPGEQRIPIEIRDGVAIDRDLKTVYKTSKYDFEVISPGTRFAVEVFIENPKEWLMGLLVLGFDQLATGFTALGGFASRGLGRVDLEWSRLTRCTATSLLLGETASVTEGSDLVAKEMDTWRDALATRARTALAMGDSHGTTARQGES